MSSDVTAGLTPDQYGQVHPVETPAMIADKLVALQGALDPLPDAAKVALRQAQTACPAQLTDEFKLMFLRAEVFDATVS